MTVSNSTLTAVLENWANHVGPARRIEPQGNAGGFSGASFWRVSTPNQIFCLRRWPPEHPSPERLHWIHTVLRLVSQASRLPLALPLPTAGGSSFFLHAGYLWELNFWLPGKPYQFLHSPTNPLIHSEPDLQEHLQTGMQALAKFHRAASTCELPEQGGTEKGWNWGTSPGLESRASRLKQLLQPEYIPSLRAYVLQHRDWPAGAALALSILEKVGLLATGVNAMLQTAQQHSTALHPCIRDIWSDHLLFTDAELTGWVDFGAMRRETPSADIARLLGSMAGDNPARWQLGLQAYEAIHPLSDQQHQLIRTFDACQVLLSGLNWIEWILKDGRTFEDLNQIEVRLQNIERRLSHRLQDPERLF